MELSSVLASRDVAPSPNVSYAQLANLTQVVSVIENDLTQAVTLEQSFLKPSIFNVALSTLFFGLFTVLAAVATYVLFSKGIKRRTPAIMLAAIVLMWMSTLAYWTGTLVAAAEVYTNLLDLTWQNVGHAGNMLGCLSSLSAVESDAASRACYQELESGRSDYAAYNVHNCIGTAALTVNVVIGDSVVWWRAWVLWPGSRVVRSVCIIMILLTTVMGIMDTRDACTVVPVGISVAMPTSAIMWLLVATRATYGTMFSGNAWGIAAALSSLLTNVVATTLIAYRAWEHRRIIISYFRGSPRHTQVERTLALLVESGLLYCALWVCIVAYALASKYPVRIDSAFENGFYYVMEGCIVPLIGMYPTLVIIVCAVDKSLYEKSLSHDGAWKMTSIVFADASPTRPRGTLSELLGAHHDPAAEDIRPSSEHPKDESNGRRNIVALRGSCLPSHLSM
ncbi:hypothetical protein L226DRAFT_572094 [Lentinus tigrinus ALCF2SS1-7]|uniref:Uncharacterized protein n=1 Tax=Lentinus tigrinus ALCF2SS1-6 TaxID=1328759 RepID=A0A5C2RSC1_9APHY|nr:hypothetical protein L227DRAFT_616417 [Lentinus tigrinus ALCF2SS1-6]RPD73834.1 hypothetical protein L226DRAFT_572094 [Lentinus tigrinus ALCF2SS1-7]